MPPTTRERNSLRYRFLTRLPLEVRTRIYEFAVIGNGSMTPNHQMRDMPALSYVGPRNKLPKNFKDSKKTRRFFPALILDLGRSLSPIVLEAREVYFRKNLFQVREDVIKSFVTSMRQLGVDHWIHNVKLLIQPPRNLFGYTSPWELGFFELLSLPLRRLEVNSQSLQPNLFPNSDLDNFDFDAFLNSDDGLNPAGNHALQDYQMQLLLLEQQRQRRALLTRFS